METNYCWQILGLLLFWISQIKGQQLQYNGGLTSTGYRTVGYYSTRDARGGINRYALQVRIGTRPNTASSQVRIGTRPNTAYSLIGRNSNVVISRPTGRSVSQQALTQRPTLVYTGTPGRYATARAVTRSARAVTRSARAVTRAAPVIYQPISVSSTNPARQYRNLNPVYVNNGQRTFLVNVPALMSATVSQAMSRQRRNIWQNRLVQQLRVALLSSLSRANIPALSPSNVASGLQNVANIPAPSPSNVASGPHNVANIPAPSPSNVASGPHNVVENPQSQVQSNTDSLQRGTIRANMPQINSQSNNVPVNPIAATQTSGTSGSHTTTTSTSTSSSGDPDTDKLVHNILNEVRSNRRFHSSGDINAASDDVIRRGDRIYKPLYKGNMFGDRILIARGIGRNENVQDSETPYGSFEESIHRSEGMHVVGDDVWNHIQRFTVEGTLPTEDVSNEVNVVSTLSDSEDDVHEINEHTSASKHHHDVSQANDMLDRDEVNVVTRMSGRQDTSNVHELNEHTSETKHHQGTHPKDIFNRHEDNVYIRFSDIQTAPDGFQPASNNPRMFSSDEWMPFQVEAGSISKALEKNGRTLAIKHHHIPPARDMFNKKTVNEITRLSDFHTASDGFLQASNNPSMFSSDEWEAFGGNTESNPRSVDGIEQGIIRTSHSIPLPTGTDASHRHPPLRKVKVVQKDSRITDTSSTNSDWAAEDGFISSSSAERLQSDDLSHMHQSSKVHSSSLDAAVETGTIQTAHEDSLIVDTASTNPELAVGDGFISSSLAEGQHRDSSHNDQAWKGLAPRLNAAFARGNVLSVGLYARDDSGSDDNIGTWNSREAIDALWSTEISPTSQDRGSINMFDMSKRFTGNTQSHIDQLPTSFDAFNDADKSMQTSASLSQNSDQFEKFWSDIGEKLSSEVYSDTAAVDSLSCPYEAMDFGVCLDDSDCMVGYCFRRGSMRGVCCK